MSNLGPGNAQSIDPSVVTTPRVEGPWTVDKALATIDKPAEGSTSAVPFFHLLERLKITKREGWRRFGIQRGESVADHSCRMAMMAAFPPTSLAQRLDTSKCIKMCLFHDTAESLVGDLTPADGVPKPERHRREGETLSYFRERLLVNVDAGDAAGQLAALWQEFEDGETLESRFVQDIDKIEMLLQMTEYERRAGGHIDLSEFTYVATKILLPETKAWADEILREREEFWKTHHAAGAETRHSVTKEMQDAYYGK